MPKNRKYCPDCGSENIDTGLEISSLSLNDYMCHSCSSIGEVEDLVDSPPVRSCKNCAAPVTQIVKRAAGNYCNECKLFTDRVYPSATLAKFWKAGSGIQRIMRLNKPCTKFGTRIGDFLRNECGPHCTTAKDCQQDTTNLCACLKKAGDDGVGMKVDPDSQSNFFPKKSSSTKSYYPGQGQYGYPTASGYEENWDIYPGYNLNRGGAYCSKPKPALLKTAPRGWYASKMNGNNNKQQTGDKGGR